MNTALLFLLVRSVRGRVVRMLRRLREPKYLVGFLIGAGWISFWFSGLVIGRMGGNVQFGAGEEFVEALAGPFGQVIQLGAAFALTIGFILWWMVPFGRRTLEFNEAELHMLLPAPIARRDLMQYAIFRSQPPIMLGAAIVSFMSGGASPVGLLTRFLGVWIFFSAWDLHGKARGLWLARLSELPPAAAWRKRVLLWVLLLVYLALVIFAAGGVVLGVMASPLADGSMAESPFADGALRDDVRGLLTAEAEAAWNSLLGWLLTPLLLTVRPYFLGFGEDTALQVLAAWAFPLLMLLLHNEWVVRSQTRFEEAALDHAKRASQKLDPAARFWRQSQRARSWSPFRLDASGAPEVAIVWKNMMIASRFPLLWMIAAGLAGIAALVALMATRLVPPWFATVVQFAAGIFVVIAPLLTARSMRQDLRADLLKVETIRPWPIAGWRLFLAETATPVVFGLLQCTAGAILLIAMDQLTFLGVLDAKSATGNLGAQLRVPASLVGPLAFAGYLPIAFALAALAVSVENLAALAFPSWVQLGLKKTQAASRVGQNLLVFFVLSLVIALGMAPGALLIAAIVAVQVLVWGVPVSGWELPLLGLLGAIPVGAVVTALVRFGGVLWERLDPSEELLAGRA